MATDDRIFQLCIYMSGGGEIEMLVEREELRAFEESVLAQPQPRTFEFGIDDTGRLIVLLEHVRAYDSFVASVAGAADSGAPIERGPGGVIRRDREG